MDDVPKPRKQRPIILARCGTWMCRTGDKGDEGEGEKREMYL